MMFESYGSQRYHQGTVHPSWRSTLQSVLLALALVSAVAVAGPGAGWSAQAAEPSADLKVEAEAALNAFWGGALKGTPDAIEPVLAPEFQIQRADGSGYDKQAYLESKLAKFTSIPEFTDLDVTASGDILVVRYMATVDSTRDGKTVQRHAPRLTVFRRDGNAWLVVAHANFAPVEE